ncbi:MAG TPA: hypothetical protein VKQ30_09320 [Ktedonobacterales bacterium]|nr:hypothetical protein [Ktedonobacterales bacterium]
MATQCARCGAALPAGMTWSAPSSPRLTPGGAEMIDGVFREEDAQPPVGHDRIPQWLARTLQQTGQIPSVPPLTDSQQGAGMGRMPDPYQPPPAQGTPFPGRTFSGPPPLTPARPPFDAASPFGPSVPSILPDGSMRPALGALSGGATSRPAPPMVNSAPSMDIRPMGPVNVSGPAGAGQPPAQGGMALAQPLGPGTLLKGGRYRLIQRFHPAGAPEPQGNEPPVMLASDIEQPNGRVLIQEVLINSAFPEDAERVRRVLAQRLEDLARGGGLPPLIDNFTERRRHFLVFEMPSGELLSDRLARARGSLDETQAIGYALQVLDVLQRFERERPPFIHGNICPANILVRQSGQVVLVGVSTTLLLHPDGVVAHGQAAGIPGYAGPEQSRGQATPRSDLYAVCAVLHHMVTGTVPTPRPTPLFQPARRLNPEVSLELEEALSQGLRPSPTQRYQSVAELRAVLGPLASGRRATHVPDDLRDPASAHSALAPVRDAKGRLVLPHRRSAQNPLMLLGAILALIVLIGGGVLYIVSPHLSSGARATSTATADDRAALYQSRGIALSSGDFVLDTQRTDNNLKQRAAVALASGDSHSALSDYESAIASDQSDAEAAIYLEDLRLQSSGAPSVTVVAAIAFGAPSDTAQARAELQGVFLAQQYINSNQLLPGGLRVRVLILNSGPNSDDASTACNVLLQEIQAGNAQHLVGIIGWPESQQTELAISVLAPTGLAIVSPTADADALQGNHGNFFALVPAISQQAANLADAAVTSLNAQRILVLSDPQNAQSAAAAAAFLQRANHNISQVVVATHASFTSDVSTVKDFNGLVAQAVAQADTLIFIAGSDQDSYNLAAAVSAANAANGTSMRALALSDSLTPALLGMGSDPLAAIVRTTPAPLASLYIAGFADAGEWGQNGINMTRPGFFDDYAGQFGANAEPIGLPNADASSILAYDGTRVLLSADAHAIKTVNGQLKLPDPTTVRLWLLQYNASHPYQGIGGAIAFTQTGSEPNKSLVILKLSPTAQASENSSVAQISVIAIVGGKTTFCGNPSSSCDLSA